MQHQCADQVKDAVLRERAEGDAYRRNIIMKMRADRVEAIDRRLTSAEQESAQEVLVEERVEVKREEGDRREEGEDTTFE